VDWGEAGVRTLVVLAVIAAALLVAELAYFAVILWT
jgi:hypothetical protein